MKFDELYTILEKKTIEEDYTHHDVRIKKLLEFIDDRKAGAEKIANQSSKKAGVSRLTAAHFKAKLPLYDKIYKAVKSGKNVSYIKKDYKKTLSDLRKLRSNQIKFQELTGKLEVLGEILIESGNV